MYRRVAQFAQIVWCVVVFAVALAFYNYPRSWWQETISQTAALWALPFGAITVAVIKRWRRVPSVIVLVLIVWCIGKVGQVLFPYVYGPPKSYPALSYSSPVRFLVVDSTQSSVNDFPRLIEREDPDVVVLTRDAGSDIFRAPNERYPFVLASSIESTRKVEVFSKLPFGAPRRTEYGFDALPAVMGSLQTPDGASFLLGAFDLLPASSQESFNKSRLTSRRLASAIKFSAEPRIVVGAFRASVTSQVVDMYVEQLKLRSIFFNGGLSRAFALVGDSIPFQRNLNVFTARKIQVSGVEDGSADERGSAFVTFTARIPRAEPGH